MGPPPGRRRHPESAKVRAAREADASPCCSGSPLRGGARAGPGYALFRGAASAGPQGEKVQVG